MKQNNQKTIYLSDYRPSDFRIESVGLVFKILESCVVVQSRLSVAAANEKGQDLVLNGAELKLLSIRMDGKKLSAKAYRVDSGSMTIFSPPKAFVLEIETEIHPAENTSLEGLYLSNGIYCTQCEAEGFRKITYFLDRPDIMAPYTTTIEGDVEKTPVLLANGNLIDSGKGNEGRHFATWEDPFGKPCYLFAMVAGNLVKVEDCFKTRSGRTISLQIYVEPHNREKCGHALRALQKAMRWDEKVFGLEYDLDQYMIVAVDDFNAGAMENKGLNVFNSKYVLANPQSATDDDYEAIEAVVAHEYFHNWTGNRVTCRDWFQLSLKEGLTVFRDQEFSADIASRPVKRIQDVRILRNHQFPEDAGPMAHPVRPASYVEINNFYTVTVYEKGAEVVRMLHTIVGPELFRQGMDLYFERYDGQAVATDDFVQCMADVFNQEGPDGDRVDFEQFRLWYSQAGTPEITVRSRYDGRNKKYFLTVRQQKPSQSDSHDKMMLIPVVVGLLDKKGRDLPLQFENEEQVSDRKSRVLHVTKEEETFTFVGVPEKPIPSILRGFSAPVTLHYEYTDEELLFLLTHDSDPFNRWEAGQRYYTRQLLSLVETRKQGGKMLFDADLEQLFIQILARKNWTDESFVTQLLTLPSEEHLAEQMDVVDVDGIHAAREFVRRSLAETLRGLLLDTYNFLLDREPYKYDPKLAGRRGLKNLCLSYLAVLDDREIIRVVLRQQEQADNMSDEIAALRCMAHKECTESEQSLALFAAKWETDPLVFDKWFTVQATAPLPGTLKRVMGLMRHPRFSIKNPNRVRALIGAFAGANPVCFHAADGAGYSFLADIVLELDKLNPQIASRLLGRLSRWRKYDSQRQLLMQKELKRVASRNDLSKGAREVVQKCLDG
jgi:aminopeptidase N